MEFSKKNVEAKAKIRYNASEVKCSLKCINKSKIKVEFKEPQRSVTPGQSIVFYKGDTVLGGAIIDSIVK